MKKPLFTLYIRVLGCIEASLYLGIPDNEAIEESDVLGVYEPQDPRDNKEPVEKRLLVFMACGGDISNSTTPVLVTKIYSEAEIVSPGRHDYENNGKPRNLEQIVKKSLTRLGDGLFRGNVALRICEGNEEFPVLHAQKLSFREWIAYGVVHSDWMDFMLLADRSLGEIKRRRESADAIAELVLSIVLKCKGGIGSEYYNSILNIFGGDSPLYENHVKIESIMYRLLIEYNRVNKDLTDRNQKNTDLVIEYVRVMMSFSPEMRDKAVRLLCFW